MILTACFTVWNGLELLQKSFDNIYNNVDNIIICYQKISNKGNNNPDIKQFLEEFQGRNKLYIIEFVPDLRVNTKENERRKHQQMIDFAKKLESTHYLLAATDHFYKEEEFKYGKELVEKENFDVSFTKMYTYYKEVTWQIDPPEEYYMPFICKLYPNTAIIRMPYYPVLVDPSVQVNTFKKNYVFKPTEIMLHHYSMIREDIKNKFDNAAASIRWTPEQIKTFTEEYENYDLKKNEGVTYFKGAKIKIVENWFGL